MNVPKLRFKEFNDEYKTYCINELGDVITGTTPSTSDRENYGNEYLWASPIDMGQYKYVTDTKNKLSAKGFKKVRPIPKDSILITCIGSTIGKMGMAYKEMATNQQINTLICNDKFNNNYMYYCIGYNFPRFLNKISFQAVPIISKSEFEKLRINCSTDKLEQTKVSNFLSLLDKKIELQIKKIEDLKLFTKKTSKELIKKYTINLEDKYVQDICKIQTGKSNTQDKNKNGKYPFYIRSEEITYSDKYIFDCEAVLTIGDGNIGKVYFYKKGKFDCHQRVYVMNNFDQSILGKYFYYYFSNNFYKRAKSMSAKNTVDSVRLEMISKMKIRIPKIVEQQKIVNILSTLDNKILFENNKLKCLISLKKGLMQNMFV